MALNPSNNSNLEQLALKGLTHYKPRLPLSAYIYTEHTALYIY